MSHWEHSRFKIFNPGQHPLKHDVGDLAYFNPRLPRITTLTDALDYIVAVLYPHYIGTFATPAALPATSNPNDYALVNDDGDGKAAGYVYTSLDGVTKWVKRMDVDWSVEGVLAEAIDRTLPMYVHKYGLDDRDDTGTITGIFAGQSVYGGASASTNLTLRANSGDTAGAHTGFVQVDDDFRPAVNGAYDLGKTNFRFKSGYFQSSVVTGTLSISPAAISDSSGAIGFGTTNLSTSGTITTGALTATSGAVGAISISGNVLTSSTGTLNLSGTNLTTSGSINAGASTFGGIWVGSGSISASGGTIDFNSNTLTGVGSLTAGTLTATSSLAVGNLSLSGNTVGISQTNGNLILAANGTGKVDIQSPLQTLGQTITGTVSISGQFNIDDLRLDGAVISSTALNANIDLSPNGSGAVRVAANLLPSGSRSLGLATDLWTNLYVSGAISSATTQITISDLLTLRSVPYRDSSRTTPAVVGDSLFWNGAQWLAGSSTIGTIAHSGLTGLTSGDSGHTQFVMLAGRSGGQTVQGGTAASESLVLESTSHATKGTIQVKDHLVPQTSATFSGGWQGTDLGDATHYYRDVYTRGVFKNFRLENFTSATLPSSSGQNVGRVVWATDNSRLYVDTGTTWVSPAGSGGGASKFLQDLSFSGSETLKDVTVSASITDARNAIWQLCDNSNDFERIFCSIKAMSATTVRITVNPALPAGSYRLIGIE